MLGKLRSEALAAIAAQASGPITEHNFPTLFPEAAKPAKAKRFVAPHAGRGAAAPPPSVFGGEFKDEFIDKPDDKDDIPF